MRPLAWFIFAFSLLGPGRTVLAYHHFIAHGYSSCMTCHYNGAGGGALNDYGRALFAAEITARWVFPKSVEEDKIAESSRFLGFADLPYWLRPALKYRGLSVESNPGSGSQVKRWIPMQREVYLTLAADEDNKYIFVGSMTYNSEPRFFSTGLEDREEGGWAVKEAYLRLQLNDSSWLYAGQMDKPFGIREVNHTAYSRRAVAMTQYDQSAGVMYHRNIAPWEGFLMVFGGNTAEVEEARLQGASALIEYEPMEKVRLGFSLLSEKSERLEKTAFAVHERMGLGTGSALSAELGLFEDKDLLTAGAEPVLGAYALLQNYFHLDRGINLLTEFEWLRPDTRVAGLHMYRWNLGFLLFPLPRTEVRASAVNTRTFSNTMGAPEGWALQTQIHWSL